MPSAEDRIHHSVLAQSAPNAFRLCIFPEPVDENPEEPDLDLKNYQAIPVHRDAEGKVIAKKKGLRFAYDPPTGIFRLDGDSTEILSGQARTVTYPLERLKVSLNPDDMVYGLGAASGQPHRQDQHFLLRTIDTLFYSIPDQTYTAFPFFLIRSKNRFRAVYLNSTYPVEITTTSDAGSEEGASVIIQQYRPEKALPLDLFCFEGSIAQILNAYTSLTGRPLHIPLWSMGFHQSRWSYKTEQRVMEIAEGFRQRDLPLDAIHLDIHYMDRYRVFTWDQKRFPNPAAMNKKLAEKGIRTVAIVDPGVFIGEDYSVYLDGLKQDLYCKRIDSDENYEGKVWPGPTVFPDFAEEKTRIWWASHHKTLFDAGVSGIWNDMNEPVLQIGKTSEPLDQPIRHQSDSHLKFRNQYGNLEARATNDGFARWKKGQRSFVLTRSATCGIQKYAAVWTGDNHSTWNHLRFNLHMILNLGLTGVPISGADVGGFCRGPGTTGAVKIFKNRELFARWMELGSLMPFFRVHTVLYSYSQEPWSFGEEALEISRKHMNRRYRLLHYISSLVREAHLTGAPLVRPIWYEFPEMEDPNLEQFMLGPNLLAAPVMAPGIRKRKVDLPFGDWFEFESGRRFVGGQTHYLDTRPGYYPLFVRGGAMLPTCPARRNAEESVRAGLHLELYPAESIQGSVFLDDGITADQTPTEVRVRGQQARNGQLSVQIEVIPGDYMPPYRNFQLRLPGVFRHMLSGTQMVSAQSVDATREDRSLDMVYFELPLESGSFTFDFRNAIQGN